MASLLNHRPAAACISRTSIAQLNKRFDAEGKFINYYNDAANNQLHLDTSRLQQLGFSLKDVAAFLEGLEVFEAAFTEDEVRAAQARLK